jgi:hypothetical protein
MRASLCKEGFDKDFGALSSIGPFFVNILDIVRLEAFDLTVNSFALIFPAVNEKVFLFLSSIISRLFWGRSIGL